ncbi:NAD-dependent epimerase/dehydratase family protein [Planctomycetales bacterium ZRK34]|nr:NAD-dependent epimerase/dehydratase family protein [Planctomycetales bacterium ZRK34]
MDWTELHADAFDSQRVLVTGAAGFIGSHLVEALVGLGAEIVALDDLTNGDWSNLDGFDTDVRKITGSILDAETLAEAVAGCRYVFHEAALGSVPRSVREPRRFFDVNVNGTLNVLEAAAAAGVERLIFAASSSAYGDRAEGHAKVETMAPMPLSPYAATKVSCETMVRAWAHSFGLDTASLRYFNIFGPRQRSDSAYAAVIAAFARALHEGRPGTIYGDGSQSRDFTFVANAVHANLLAARNQAPLCGEVINVATGSAVDVNELHRQMAALYDHADLSPIHEPARTGDILHSLAEVGKAKLLLGYQPLIDFEAGLARTVDWYKQNMATAR